MSYKKYLLEANEPDAWTQYQDRAGKVNKQMKDMENAIKKHYAKAKSQKNNWSLSADMIHVYDLMSEILQFLNYYNNRRK
jgi:hypothetical protein